MAKENKTKRMTVKQKDYLGLIAPQHATKLWGNDKDVLKTYDPQNERKKDTQEKVKQKDLMTLINMKDDKNSLDGKNKSLVKSTKQRRAIFMDGYQVGSQDLKARMVFSGSDMNHKHNKERENKREAANASAKVKRFYFSKEGPSYHTLPKHESKHRRQKLHEENPVDLGAVLHDKLKNWSPHTGPNVKVRLPIFGSTSKSYDLLKAKEDKTFSNSLESKKPSTVTNSEIYISLEKKTPQEKKDYIKQSNPKLFDDYAELCNLSPCEKAECPEDDQNYSHIGKDNGMLF